MFNVVQTNCGCVHHGTGKTLISFFNSSYKSLYSGCSRTKTVTVPRFTPIAAPNSWRLGTYVYGTLFSSQTAGRWHIISIGDTSPANKTMLKQRKNTNGSYSTDRNISINKINFDL